MAAPAVRFISQSISHEKEAQIVLNRQMSHLIALTGLKVTSWIFAKLNTPFDTFYNNINLAHHISLEFSSFESLTESVHNQLTLHIDLLLFFFFLFFFQVERRTSFQDLIRTGEGTVLSLWDQWGITVVHAHVDILSFVSWKNWYKKVLYFPEKKFMYFVLR